MTLQIPDNEIELRASRSSGPGGQHANVTASRIEAVFDIERSSTRREEILLGPDITPRVWLLRRMFGHMITTPPNGAGMDLTTATEAILDQLRQSENNMEFLEQLGKNGR